MLENMQVSVGRGTDTPFVIVGAPWFNALQVADYLNARDIPGVRFLAKHFTPTEPPHKGQECFGLDIQLLDRDKFDSSRVGLELMAATLKFHPGKYTLDRKIMLLLGSDKTAEMLKKGTPPEEIRQALSSDLEEFRRVGKNICCTNSANRSQTGAARVAPNPMVGKTERGLWRHERHVAVHAVALILSKARGLRFSHCLRVTALANAIVRVQALSHPLLMRVVAVDAGKRTG